jgi:predicted  nucleic acid-binding Zn-ribbon protein
MKVNDRVYGDVIDSSEIVTCPNCGRILYYQPEEEQATAA